MRRSEVSRRKIDHSFICQPTSYRKPQQTDPSLSNYPQYHAGERRDRVDAHSQVREWV